MEEGLSLYGGGRALVADEAHTTSSSARSNLTLMKHSNISRIDGSAALNRIRGEGGSSRGNEDHSAVVQLNMAALAYTTGQTTTALGLLNRCIQLTAANGDLNSLGVLVQAHLLILEVMHTIIANRIYIQHNSPTMSKEEIIRTVQDSKEALKGILSSHFHSDDLNHVPTGANILALNPPASTSFTFQPSSDSAVMVQYGYTLYCGVVVALHIHTALARVCLALSELNTAKIHIRGALDLHNRHLRPVGQCVVNNEAIASVGGSGGNDGSGSGTPVAVEEILSLVPLVGSLRLPREADRSLWGQVGRHHRLVMDVLAQYYYRSHSYSDALNSLCGQLTVQPLPTHALLDALLPHTNEHADNVTTRSSRINNAACVLLRTGKPAVAGLLLQQALAARSSAAASSMASPSGASGQDGDVIISENFPGSLRRASTSAVRYNLAQVSLRQGRPLEALLQLNALEGCAEVEQKPYIWIRRAECCILHQQLLWCCLQQRQSGDGKGVARRAVETEVITGGELQRLKITLPHSHRPDPFALSAQLATALRRPEGPADYLTLCMTQLQQSSGFRTCPPTELEGFIVSALVQASGLSKATDYLGTALGIVNRALNRGSSAGAATVETHQHLLSLKSAVLLKMTYLHLMMGNPHSALIVSQELRQLPSSVMTEHCKHLATFYHVEILCRLGSEHEAAVLLKASAAATMGAWQSALTNHTTGDSSGGGGSEEQAITTLLPPSMFFSGALRVQELTASPGLVGALLKLLHRVNDAVVLLVRSEVEAARVILEDVVRQDRDLVPAVQNLLYVYVRQGKSQEALALLRLVNCALVL